MFSKLWKPSPAVKEIGRLFLWNLLIFLAISAIVGVGIDVAGVYGSI